MQDDGSEESWEQFVQRYELVIIEYAIASGLQHDQVEDLRQSVFIELINILPTILIDPTRGSFRTILRKIVQFRSIDLIRRQYRDSSIKAELSRTELPEQDPHWDYAWRAGLMKQALTEVAQRVNPETYQAFELGTLHNVPAKEISKMLGISVDSVYQNSKRVKDAAERCYQQLVREAEGDHQ